MLEGIVNETGNLISFKSSTFVFVIGIEDSIDCISKVVVRVAHIRINEIIINVLILWCQYEWILLYLIQILMFSEKQLRNLDQENPYELIKVLNKKLSSSYKTIEEYDFAYTSLQNERQIASKQMFRLQKRIESLKSQLQIERNMRKENQIQVQDMKYKLKLKSQGKTVHQPIRNNFSRAFQSDLMTKLSSTAKSNVFENKNYNQVSLNAKRQEASQEQYIPEPVRLSIKDKKEHRASSFLNPTVQDKQKYNYAENLIQDFYVIGPQANQFKRERNTEKNKNKNFIQVSPGIIHNINKFYKTKKSQFLTEIANRAFPMGCSFQKKLIDHPLDLQNIIEYKPQCKISADYFVFTLKGDESLLSTKKKVMLTNANPYYFLYIICLKTPEFYYVRDQKHYHRKESQVWITQKIYAIATYFPFFPIIINILYKINNILRQNCIQKVLIEGQNPLLWGLTRNAFDVEKNEEVKDLLSYFINKKPDYDQICTFSRYYFGSIPEMGFKMDYSIALTTCSIFFTNFAYEEILLLLTSIFCQKTLVFMSQSESMATLCALFLINIIHPFQYSEPLLLNCDSEKIKSMIFQYPFSMICSIKKTQENLSEILYLFSQSNVTRLNKKDAQYILIDLDSNTILFQSVLNQLFQKCVVSPSQKLRKAYEQVNPCSSKSFSLIKPLPKKQIEGKKKFLHTLQKQLQEKKKNASNYQETIRNNRTKIPNYRYSDKHEELLKLIINYIQIFTIDQYVGSELANEKDKVLRLQNVKYYLFEKNTNQNKLIQYFVESQMYANYLDSFIRYQ